MLFVIIGLVVDFLFYLLLSLFKNYTFIVISVRFVGVETGRINDISDHSDYPKVRVKNTDQIPPI